MSTNYRHDSDSWHEWSLDLGIETDIHFKPRRLFVRIDEGGLITVTDARVTSGSMHARELEGDDTRRELIVDVDDAIWLAEALTSAREKIMARGAK